MLCFKLIQAFYHEAVNQNTSLTHTCTSFPCPAHPPSAHPFLTFCQVRNSLRASCSYGESWQVGWFKTLYFTTLSSLTLFFFFPLFYSFSSRPSLLLFSSLPLHSFSFPPLHALPAICSSFSSQACSKKSQLKWLTEWVFTLVKGKWKAFQTQVHASERIKNFFKMPKHFYRWLLVIVKENSPWI